MPHRSHAQQQRGHRAPWRGLAVLAAAALGLLSSPYAAAGVSPANPGASLDEGRVAQLEALLERLRKGDHVNDAAVDEAVQQATPSGVEAFTERLRRAVLREEGEERAPAAALLTQVTGHPGRLAARLTATQPEVNELARSIDVAFGILRADPDVPAIATATTLAGLRLAAPDGAREARRLLGQVLEAVLLRDEREAKRGLEDAFIRAAQGLEPAFPDALRAVTTPRRLELLIGLLGLRPTSDGMVLNRIHGMSLRLGPVLEERELGVLRRYLAAEEPFARTGAAQSLGALEDRGSVRDLIAMLRDPDASVRNAAHDALRHVSAMTIGPSIERWRAWLEREEAWWHSDGERDLARLLQADRAEVLAVLKRAAHHRLYRDEIAEATVYLLDSDDVVVVRVALATLEAVRARGVELAVVDLLEHNSSVVRTQAAACLRNLTGRMLPPDPRAWRIALTP